jgi:hypothetical protein
MKLFEEKKSRYRNPSHTGLFTVQYTVMLLVSHYWFLLALYSGIAVVTPILWLLQYCIVQNSKISYTQRHAYPIRKVDRQQLRLRFPPHITEYSRKLL